MYYFDNYSGDYMVNLQICFEIYLLLRMMSV